MKRPPNNFTARGDELKPRELTERAADPALVSDEALVAVLLKTGGTGVDQVGTAIRSHDAQSLVIAGEGGKDCYSYLNVRGKRVELDGILAN